MSFTLQPGITQDMFGGGLTATTDQKSFSFAVPSRPMFATGLSLTWQIIMNGGNPASINMLLEGSLQDDIDAQYITVDTSTNVAGEARALNNLAFRWLRAHQTARGVGGTSVTVRLLIP